eukprot:2861247-Amphidinium_carterae.2
MGGASSVSSTPRQFSLGKLAVLEVLDAEVDTPVEVVELVDVEASVGEDSVAKKANIPPRKKKPPPCSEAGESDPDQPWDEVEIEADIAVAAAPAVETLPSKTKEISRFLALRLVYGSATAKDLSAASSS